MIIKKNLNLEDCNNLESLGKLKEVEGKLNIKNSDNLKSLGELNKVNDHLILQGCSDLKTLGKLKFVKGTIYLFNSGITEEYIKKNKKDLYEDCSWEDLDWKNSGCSDEWEESGC